MTDKPPQFDENGVALALSGGGFRATLFHMGVVRNLYLTGILDKVTYLSSVSGGSILGAKLITEWDNLVSTGVKDRKDAFEKLIGNPVKSFTARDIRGISLRRCMRPKKGQRSTVQNFVSVLDQELLNGIKLSSIGKNVPRLSINATNLANGKRFRFGQFSVGDYYDGYSESIDDIKLSEAVAASAAFPIIFSPLNIDIKGPFHKWSFTKPPRKIDLPDQTREYQLVDGGVYDNLGISGSQRRCRTVIVSDAGLPLKNESEEFGLMGAPMRDVDIMMARITNLPISKFVKDLESGEYRGCLIRINQTCEHIATVKIPNIKPTDPTGIGFSKKVVKQIANIRTDLDDFNETESKLLAYHGESLSHISTNRFLSQYIVQNTEPTETPELSTDDLAILSEASKRSKSKTLHFWKGW